LFDFRLVDFLQVDADVDDFAHGIYLV